MTEPATDNDLWSNFNSEWLGEAADITPLLTWILMHADSHIRTHEQLILHHTAQAQHWHKLKRAGQRHIAQHTKTATPHSAASPLSLLSTNLILSPLHSPTASSPLKRVKAPTDAQLRQRFTAVHTARKDNTGGKENSASGGVEVEAVVKRVKSVLGGGGGSGVKGDGGSASKGVKFAEQAIVIGHGNVPVNDKATKKQLLKEHDREQSKDAEAAEAGQVEPPTLSEAAGSEAALEQSQKEASAFEEEKCNDQPAEATSVIQQVLVTPIRKLPVVDTRSPELVLPSLSALLQSTEDEDSATVNLHLTASTATALSPCSSPLPPPPPPPSPAVAQSPPPSRLSPFLQFHPSLSEHPYHQTLAAYQSLQPTVTAVSAVAGSPPIPTSVPSLPPRKRVDGSHPAVGGGVVRFRVDSEADAALVISTTTASASAASAPSTPKSAALLPPPPLPPRRPPLPSSTPTSAPRSAAPLTNSATSTSADTRPTQPLSGTVPPSPKHRRQRSKSVDLSAGRR